MIREFLSSLFYMCYTIVYGWFHPVEKKILFISFSGKQYSDNPRAISEKMHELYPDFRIVWILNDRYSKYGIVPPYVEVYPYGRLTFYQQLATCLCFINNNANSGFLFKRKKQLFIQTWHGDRGFKKILCEAGSSDRCYDGCTDIAVSGSRFGTQVYRDAFRYYGEVLEMGSPRNDALLNDDHERIHIIKDRLLIADEKRILLYAPTYRDSCAERQEVILDIPRILQILQDKSGGEWICLVRSHPSSHGLQFNSNLQVIDVTDYPDMTDLLLIADFLISDYSSSLLDFCLTGKPCISAAFDIDSYEKNDRNFKIRPEESGIIIARTQTELEKMIQTYSDKDYRQAYQKIAEVYGTNETGKASEEIAKRIDAFYRENYANCVSAKH